MYIDRSRAGRTVPEVDDSKRRALGKRWPFPHQFADEMCRNKCSNRLRTDAIVMVAYTVHCLDCVERQRWKGCKQGEHGERKRERDYARIFSQNMNANYHIICRCCLHGEGQRKEMNRERVRKRERNGR